MRLRLLIDVEASAEDVGRLQEVLPEQPVVVIDGLRPGAWSGRFMGAQPVELVQESVAQPSMAEQAAQAASGGMREP